MPVGTRERIVEAAVRVLAREGYGATSVKDIAAEAHVAAGLLHYHFSSKEELVIAALEHVCDKAGLEPFQVDPESAARQAFEQAKDASTERTAVRRILVEMFGLAIHNEAIRSAVGRFVTRDRAFVEAAARSVLAQREDARPAEPLAAAIWGAVVGIHIQQLIEPGFDANAAIDSLTEMALKL